MATTIFRGEDKLIELEMEDENGALDLSTAVGIQCYILDAKTLKNVLDKFSLNSESGFGTLTVSDAANGKFQVRLESAKTITAELGFYSVEIKLETDDPTYNANTRHDVAVLGNVIRIEDSKSKEDTNLLA